MALMSKNRFFGGAALALLFVALSLAVTAPMFENIGRWGVHDWPQFYSYYGVPRRAVADFQELPGWNPHYYGGNIQWGHPDDPTLSPLFLLVLIFGEVVGSKLAIIPTLAGGMFCMWLLARELSISRVSAFLAAVVWGLNGWHAYHFVVGHMDHLTFLFQPLAVLFLLRARERIGWSVAAGAVIAAMYLSGGPYPFVFTSILFVVLSLFLCGAENSVRPLKAAAVSLAFAAGFAMCKLLATLEFMLYAVGSEPDFSGTPLPVVWRALFDSAAPLRAKYGQMPWGQWEYAAFIGYLPAALFLLGAVARPRKVWPWVAAGALFFVASLGSVSPVNFFMLFTAPPGLSGMHVPFRFIVHLIFAVALVGAVGLDFIRERLSVTRVKALALPLAVVLAGVVAGRLVWMHYNRPVPLYRLASFIPTEIFDGSAQTPPEEGETEKPLPRSAGPYVAVTYPQTLIVYRSFLQGKRLGWGYDAAYLPRAALSPEDENYRGEAFFLDPQTDGVLKLSATLSRYHVEVSSDTGGIVVLNQNYHPGWRVEGAAGDAMRVGGLVAAEVPAGSREIVFVYAPRSRVVGALLTLATILVALWMTLGKRVRARRERGMARVSR